MTEIEQVSSVEQKYVIDTYSLIANDFSNTRHTMWRSVKKFLGEIKDDLNVLEVGCGNGKNMYYTNINITGIDNCLEFVKICQNNGLNAYHMSAIDLKFKDNSYDAVFSIAVIHHITSQERRKKCVMEMLRVCKIGGDIMIEVWDRTSDKYKNTNNNGDELVNFTNSDGTTHQRYYHFFDKDEFIDIVNIENGEYKLHGTIYNEKDNWIFIGKKEQKI